MIRAVNKKVLFKVTEDLSEPKQLDNGLYLSQSETKDELVQAFVVSAGHECKSIKDGMHILVERGAVDYCPKYTLNDQKIHVMDEDNVVAYNEE